MGETQALRTIIYLVGSSRSWNFFSSWCANECRPGITNLQRAAGRTPREKKRHTQNYENNR